MPRHCSFLPLSCRCSLFPLPRRCSCRCSLFSLPRTLLTLPAAPVLPSDMVSYTSISAASDPLAVLDMLNGLFHKFDKAISDHPHLYKLDMVGDW